jgi:hypothetical protein
MSSVLRDVIEIGGRALQAEDALLLASAHKHGHRGGLLRVEFERYFQFIVWKSLLGAYDAQIERPREGGYLIDLVIDEHLFEMKYWRDESSIHVNSEIRRLRQFSNGGILLVFSANPLGETDAVIQYLIDNSPLPKIGKPVDKFCFETESPVLSKVSFEFWFAGWPITPALATP